MLATYITLLLAGRSVFAQSNAIYCYQEGASDDVVDACNTIIKQANTDDAEFSCVSAPSFEECLTLEKEDTMILVNVDSGDAFKHHYTHGAQPFISESYGGVSAGLEYYSVIATKAEDGICTNGSIGANSLAGLKGKNLCGSGYRRSSGWTFPINYMIDQGILELVDKEQIIANDAEAADNFFGNICVPRATGDGPLLSEDGGGTPWERMCSGCKDTDDCTDQNAFYGYDGSIACLDASSDAVVFTRHTMFTQDLESRMDEFLLVCEDGSCVSPKNAAKCNLGAVPSHALITSAKSAKNAPMLEAVTEALLAAATDAEWLDSASRTATGDDGPLFDSATRGLAAIANLYQEYMGEKARLVHSTALTLSGALLKICTRSKEEEEFCIQHAQELSIVSTEETGLPPVSVACVFGGSADKCAAMVAKGEADLLTGVDGGELYKYTVEYQLQPILVELIETSIVSGTEYAAVAVVRSDYCTGEEGGFAGLQGGKACGTGYGKTAGFKMPTATLVGGNYVEPVDTEEEVHNDAETFRSFFGDVCVPGTGANKEDPDGVWAGLCGLCEDDCGEDSPYEGYDGAMLGLKNEICDVAFVKHTTPESFADATEDTSAGDFMYLCPGGGCEKVVGSKPSEDCLLGNVPAHTMITKADGLWRDPKYAEALESMFNHAKAAKHLFRSDANPNDLLVEGNAKGVTLVQAKNSKEFLGDAFELYKVLSELDQVTVREEVKEVTETLKKGKENGDVQTEEDTSTSTSSQSGEAVDDNSRGVVATIPVFSIILATAIAVLV